MEYGTTMDILVVGAGPTGLTTAVELARLGVLPTVIDKRAKPSGLSRAVGITPASLRLLAPSGVTERLLSAAPRLHGICAYYNDNHLLSLSFADYISKNNQDDFKTPLHCLPQDQTEAILLQRFTELGGGVDYNNAFLNLEQHDSHVCVTTSAGKFNFDYVVAADGVASNVRQCTAIDYIGYDLPEPWSIADLDVTDWLHPNEFCAFLLSDGGVCVAAPIGNDRIRLVSNSIDAQSALPVTLFVNHARRQSTFTISVRQATRYSKHRVHLAGDAAHCHSPVGGRGMNLGIADAAQLATCLVNNTCNDYHHLRHAVAKDTMTMTERGRKLLTSSSSMSQLIKPAALKLINRSTFMKRRMIQSILNE